MSAFLESLLVENQWPEDDRRSRKGKEKAHFRRSLPCLACPTTLLLPQLLVPYSVNLHGCLSLVRLHPLRLVTPSTSPVTSISSSKSGWFINLGPKSWINRSNLLSSRDLSLQHSCNSHCRFTPVLSSESPLPLVPTHSSPIVYDGRRRSTGTVWKSEQLKRDWSLFFCLLVRVSRFVGISSEFSDNQFIRSWWDWYPWKVEMSIRNSSYSSIYNGKWIVRIWNLRKKLFTRACVGVCQWNLNKISLSHLLPNSEIKMRLLRTLNESMSQWEYKIKPRKKLFLPSVLSSMNKDISYLTPEGYDLTEPQDVHDYLSKTPFASTKVVPLSGGTANYVYRLYLKNPYEGRDSLVMKHGRPYVKDYLTLAFSTERQVSGIFFFVFGFVFVYFNTMIIEIWSRSAKSCRCLGITQLDRDCT